MHKYLKTITRSILTLLLAVIWVSAYSQQGISNAEIQAQLKSKGVTEVDLQNFLDSKNISVSELERLSPEELLDLSDELDAFMRVEDNSNEIQEIKFLFLFTVDQS